MSAPSKARKSFFQAHLALCVATGTPWHGFEVTQGRVLYLNLELRDWTFYARNVAIAEKTGAFPAPDMLAVWNLRGYRIERDKLQRRLKDLLSGQKYDLIVFDPLYKLLGDARENDSSDMAKVLIDLEMIARSFNASYIVTHHFAKGNASGKESIDRSAGSNVIGRDVDLNMTLTQHAVEDHWTLDFVLRDHAPVTPKVLKWEYPMYSEDESGLDPKDLLQPRKRQKAADITGSPDLDNAAFSGYLTRDWTGKKTIVDALRKTGRTEREAVVIVDRIISQNQLIFLKGLDGVRDCGLFEAAFVQAGLKFRLKPQP